MSRKYSILALFISVALWLANQADPPNGKTGAPGEGLCTECHNPPGSGQTGTITLTGFPTTIQPNTDYPLTITNTQTNNFMQAGTTPKGGFQIVFLNSNNQQAGSFTTTDGNSHTATSSGRIYWEHFPAQVYPALPGSVSYTATWKSPSAPANTTITYYAVGNVANGNGNDGGDLIVQSSGSGMLNGGSLPLMVSITNSVNLLCFGVNTGSATAAATEGTPGYTYNWSNGGSGATISNLAAGTYTVTVTDNAAATATASVTITQPTVLALTPPTITNVSCNGGNNGSITAHASGGVAPYFFNWSNGNSGATISNLVAGSYTVTVTDNNSCTKTATYSVTEPSIIVINLVSLIHESCAGLQDGGIIITTSGGAAPLFSEWSNGFIGNSITDLAPGAYTVTVTDNNNCTKTASYTVNPGGTVAVDLIDIVNVTCPGGNNGSISVMASGGMAPYTYMWSNGGSGATISNLTAGNYLVTVTDSKGCQLVKLYTITQPVAFAITIAQAESNLCFGDANVDLTTTVTGGSSPYTGLWSNGVVGMSNPNLAAGTYTITITDNKGCMSTASSVVTQPVQLTVMVMTTDETGIGANDGTATASVTGGTGAYTYLWSNGGTTATIVGLAPGSYTVTVTDANGCTAQGTGQVDVFGCSLDVMLSADFVLCVGDTAQLMPFITGQTGNVTYLWSNGSSGSTIDITEGGEYCVTVQDNAMCQDMDCITVSQFVLTPFNCQVTNESAPGQNDGSITCGPIPNVISYLWSNGATTMSISGLAPGQYCLTVTDVNGCAASECYNVQSGNCNLTVTSLISAAQCAGDTTGSISVNVENATAPVTFNWSNGETTSTIEHLSAGAYSVTIHDGAGCVENRDYLVTEPNAIQITVDTVINITSSNPGIVLITVSGGVSPYSFLWTAPNGNQTTNEDQLAAAVPGNYSVAVTDANGCVTALDSIVVGMDVAVTPGPQFTTLKVYPVPTRDLLTIDLDHAVEEVIVTAIDGRNVLLTKALQNNILDVSSLDAGWYILRISDGNRWYIARMVK